MQSYLQHCCESRCSLQSYLQHCCENRCNLQSYLQHCCENRCNLQSYLQHCCEGRCNLQSYLQHCCEGRCNLQSYLQHCCEGRCSLQSYLQHCCENRCSLHEIKNTSPPYYRVKPIFLQVSTTCLARHFSAGSGIRAAPISPYTGFKPGVGMAFRSLIPALKCRAKHICLLCIQNERHLPPTGFNPIMFSPALQCRVRDQGRPHILLHRV